MKNRNSRFRASYDLIARFPSRLAPRLAGFLLTALYKSLRRTASDRSISRHLFNRNESSCSQQLLNGFEYYNDDVSSVKYRYRNLITESL